MNFYYQVVAKYQKIRTIQLTYKQSKFLFQLLKNLITSKIIGDTYMMTQITSQIKYCYSFILFQ